MVIPFYNRSQSIDRAIQSIILQASEIVIEILIVDDGSDYEEHIALKKICAKYPIVKIIKLKSNRGANLARNKGAEKSRGNYVAYLDSDDAWHPEYLKCVIKPLKNYDWIVTGFQVKGKHKTDYYVLPPGSHDVPTFLLEKEGHLSGSCTILKRDFAVKVKWDENLRRFQDLDYAIRLHRNGQKPMFIPKPLVVVYRDVGNRISNSEYGGDYAMAWIKSLQAYLGDRLTSMFIVQRISGLYAQEGHLRKAIKTILIHGHSREVGLNTLISSFQNVFIIYISKSLILVLKRLKRISVFS